MGIVDAMKQELLTAVQNGNRPLRWHLTQEAFARLREATDVDTAHPTNPNIGGEAFMGYPIAEVRPAAGRDIELICEAD